ncbi:MAG: ATP-dependent zinc metalloprotease FtsH [Spirochaetaceae bacterium]|jgi:cell division protease FtsH|nr:ATP-dependent zinc metalloprotease FtsH [Spirochaetaceae bacterium]
MSSENKQPVLPPQMPGDRRGFPLVFFLCISAVAIFMYFQSRQPPVNAVAYTDFLNLLNKNEITQVTIFDNSTIEWTLPVSSAKGDKPASFFRTVIPYHDPALLPALAAHSVRIAGGSGRSGLRHIVFELLPWFIMFTIFFLLMRNMQMPGRALNFGKSRARRYQEQGKKITFADVAGQMEAKAELQEVVEFLKKPQKFTEMGAKIPHGVLLVGMPGTGKTLMARAVAGEAGVAFFHMSGSDFVEMFVGVGASRVRDLFEQGRRHSPCIVFIDELDAVGRTRGAGYGGGHDEREQTLNQLLVEMDGFDSKEGSSVIVLAATNRADVLDPALLRPGRFDRQVAVALPDVKEREQILAAHIQKIKTADNVDLLRLARATPGMSGADISNLVNEAALLATRRGKESAAMNDFEDARDKILMGIARKTFVTSEKERRMTATHEAGHALLHYFLPNADPLHKVTIIPHGQALGMAVSLPEHDVYTHSRSWLEDRIVICYGGYAAERLFYSETSSGVKNDLEQATTLARKMVCEWGMAEDLGAISYGQEDEPIFLAREIARHKNYSEDTARRIDTAIRAIMDKSLERAAAILTAHKTQLETLASELLARETLDDNEVRSLLDIPVEGNTD